MLVADVSNAEQVNAAVQQIVQEIGLPDMVINSAGVRAGLFYGPGPGSLSSRDGDQLFWDGLHG
jgi:NAD(P)-dependent dehydrogenase (short-subunit alcohol dehydrogenase family)